MEKKVKEETTWWWMDGDLEVKHTKGENIALIHTTNPDNPVLINEVIVEELIEVLNEIKKAMPIPKPTMKVKR